MAFLNRNVVGYKLIEHGWDRPDYNHPPERKYKLVQETKDGDVTCGFIWSEEVAKQVLELLNERIEPGTVAS